MCGIAGFIGGGDCHVAEAMGNTLLHRGPDAGQFKMFGQVGLAHRRLAVIDLSDEGVQPMTSRDGRYTIVYNGEVYNFRSLREKYLGSVRLQSDTDTEVILELFAQLGVSAFDYLEGMYALAIYDSVKGTLHLHRDRLGKKPLYYTTAPDGAFIFGSELKALHKHPSFKSETDSLSIYQYLLFEYIPTPRTIYKDVHKLEPGQILTVKKGIVQSSQVSQVSPVLYDTDTGVDPILQLESLFSGAVQKRLVADVPVGIFLSGGLDSSLVAAFAQEHSSRPVKTFSVGFESKSFNEQASAQQVAEHLGTEHHEATLSTSDITRLLPNLPTVLDEPIGDSSIIPTLLVSEHARREVTVCLSGDGADELFLGYGTFYAHRVAGAFHHLPLWLRNAAYTAAIKLPVSHSYMSFDFKLKRFLRGCVGEPRLRNTLWLSALDPEQIQSLSSEVINQEELFAPIEKWHQGTDSLWQGVKQEYLQGYLLDDILVKADRASMHYGLEVRSPFLDERLVNFAAQLNDHWKLRGRTQKYILKKLAETRLPHEIIYRKKQGFNFPVGDMIRNELKQEFRESLLDGGLQKLGIFRRDRIEQLLTEHVNGDIDHRKALWSLYVLGKWADKWG
ncbi:MAG: asparagine synthase (glutamine-hydrolyzing) [Candidatus Paceibacteria bacterium]|jgi:asparagine synthase (glutamine-hydrolysing)